MSPDVARACLEAGAIAVNDVLLPGRRAAGRGRAGCRRHAHPHARSGIPSRDARIQRLSGRRVRRCRPGRALRMRRAAADRATSLGLNRRALVMDPGLGFAKNARQSLELLRRTSDLVTRLDDAGSRGGEPQVLSPDRRPGCPPLPSAWALRSPPRRWPCGPERRSSRVHDVRCDTASHRSDANLGRRDVIEGFLHLFQARHWSQVLIDVFDIAMVAFVIYRALLVLRAGRRCDCRWGWGSGSFLIIDVIARYAGLRDPEQPLVFAPSVVVDHPHRRRRLPERHSPRAHARRRARLLQRHHPRAGVAHHRRGGGRRHGAGPPSHGRPHLLRARREPGRVRGGTGDRHRRRRAARAHRGPIRAREREQTCTMARSSSATPSHREGGGLLPHARHEAARQVARVTPPAPPSASRKRPTPSWSSYRRSADPSASASTATSSRTSMERRSGKRSLGLFGQRTRKKKSAPHKRPSGHTGSTRLSARAPFVRHTGNEPYGLDPPPDPWAAMPRDRPLPSPPWRRSARVPLTPARIETPKPMHPRSIRRRALASRRRTR